MPNKLQVAYQLAPVFVQRVHHQNPRGDFITRIDFTKEGDLTSLLDNWVAVNRLKAGGPIWTDKQWANLLEGKKAPAFEYELKPYIYYSIVETVSHYFVIYAAYHPQDWHIGQLKRFTSFNGPQFGANDHEHDIEGALVVTRKKDRLEDLRADIIITLSHWDFYSYAFWYLTDKVGRELPVFEGLDEDIYKGASENIDGKIWAVWHTDEKGDVRMRPQLFVEFKGHGIKGEKKGDKTGWGGNYRTIRYCPSGSETDEPAMFREESPDPDPSIKLDYRTSPDNTSGDRIAHKEVYRYELIDIFGPGGIWENRDNLKLFRENDDRLKCFAVRSGRGLKAGSAKPPWSWDDWNDRHQAGDLAIRPAKIVDGYIRGLAEFSLDYVNNKYLGI